MNNLRFAVAMERYEKKYYLRQDGIYKDNEGLKKVLAKDEREHANIVDDLLHNVKNKLKDRDFLVEVKNIFSEAPDIVIEESSVNKEVDFYKGALIKEQESINLYKELKDKTEKVEEKAIFEFLISQKEDHYNFIEDLIKYFERHGQVYEVSEYGFRCEMKH